MSAAAAAVVPMLPTPSKRHATCAWCGFEAGTIVELIDHVDADHLGGGSTLDGRDVAQSA